MHKVAQATVVEVQQRLTQVPDRAVDERQFVHGPRRVEARRVALEQAELIVGEPARVTDDVAEQIVVARDPEPAVPVRVDHRSKHFVPQRR